MTATPFPKSIYTCVAEYLRNVLEEHCITNVVDPQYRAKQVILGRLQDDPVEDRIHLEVNIADPSNTESMPSWSDKPAEKDQQYVYIAPYEVGGGERWIRCFSVDVKAYFNRTDEARLEAQAVGLWMFSRAMEAIRLNAYPTNLVDDFGERVMMMLVTRAHAYESGGEGDWMWKGKFYVNVWTDIPGQ
jgi:hypothetical protein